MTKDFKLAGLFAGVGGIELGFQQAGFNPVVGNEIDIYASQTYGLNHSHPLITKDINELETAELPKFNILTGGFPCQAFSVAGYQRGFNDPRGNVFWQIIRLVEDREPDIVFLENVKNLGSHDNGKTLRIIREALEANGYHVTAQVLNASKYSNIPQNRERIYIVGFKNKKAYDNFDFPGESKSKLHLSDLIDFNNEIEDRYYYRDDKYMYKELQKSIKSKETTYQWRRQYVRENKSGECPTLTANMGTGGHNVPLILSDHGIRKLTPRECFNLMGFPKNFKLPENLANAHLYKQAGNAVVVPVIKSIALNVMSAIQGDSPISRSKEQRLF